MDKETRESKLQWVKKRSHFILSWENESYYPALSPDLRAVLAFVRTKASSLLREVSDIEQRVLDSRGALGAPDARDARGALEARVRSLVNVHDNLELLIQRLLKDNPVKPFEPEVRAQILGIVDDPRVHEIVRAMTRDDVRFGLRGHRVRKQTRRDF